MTWLGTVRSTGIDVSQRFGSWRAATPDVAWECVSPKHTFQVAPGSMVRR